MLLKPKRSIIINSLILITFDISMDPPLKHTYSSFIKVPNVMKVKSNKIKGSNQDDLRGDNLFPVINDAYIKNRYQEVLSVSQG